LCPPPPLELLWLEVAVVVASKSLLCLPRFSEGSTTAFLLLKKRLAAMGMCQADARWPWCGNTADLAWF